MQLGSKIFLTILFIIAFETNLHAQTLAFRIGPNFSTQAWETKGLGISPGYITNLHAGVCLNQNMTKKISVQLEATYSITGHGSYQDGINSIAPTSYKYLNLGLMVKYYPVSSLSILVGPQIGFLLREPGTGDWNEDLGLVLGSEYYFDKHIGIGFRYVNGLVDVNKSLNLSQKHRDFQLSLILRIASAQLNEFGH
jgi:hypothetical protein